MNFIDEVKIYLKAGNGGHGISSFRREKYINLGGANGGNGGNGGDIIFKVKTNLRTLIDFKYQQHFRAFDGKRGQINDKTGKSGNNLIINVPEGTQILSEDKQSLLYDLNKVNEKIIILKGGSGGLGNKIFTSSINQAPKKFTEGKRGNEICVWLNLKLLSDIGLIGLPNAGKSTFLSKITNAKSNIKNYPFTTLKPQLGAAYYKHNKFTIMDIPGLIKNAHTGHGLGISFLKHIEKSKILLHIIDIASSDIIKDYLLVKKEMNNFNELKKYTEIILLSKADTISDRRVQKNRKSIKEFTDKKILIYSNTNIDNSLLNIKKSLFIKLEFYKSGFI